MGWLPAYGGIEVRQATRGPGGPRANAYWTRPMDLRVSVTLVWSSVRKAANSIRRLVEVQPAALLEGGLPGGALDHLGDGVGQCGHILLADVGADEQAAPVDQRDVDALRLQGRHLDAGQGLVRRDADAAQLAGRDLRRELLIAADAGRDMATQDRGERLAAAGMGDVVDLGRINARRLGDQPGQDVVRTAGGAAAPGDRAGVGLQLGDEVAHVLDRRIRRAPRPADTRR